MGRLPQKAETHPRQINNENYQRAATAVEPTTKSSLFEVPLIHLLLIEGLLRAFFAMFSAPEYPYSFAMCLVLTVLCIVIAVIWYEVVERRVVKFLQTMVRNIEGPRIMEHVS